MRAATFVLFLALLVLPAPALAGAGDVADGVENPRLLALVLFASMWLLGMLAAGPVRLLYGLLRRRKVALRVAPAEPDVTG